MFIKRSLRCCLNRWFLCCACCCFFGSSSISVVWAGFSSVRLALITAIFVFTSTCLYSPCPACPVAIVAPSSWPKTPSTSSFLDSWHYHRLFSVFTPSSSSLIRQSSSSAIRGRPCASSHLTPLPSWVSTSPPSSFSTLTQFAVSVASGFIVYVSAW